MDTLRQYGYFGLSIRIFRLRKKGVYVYRLYDKATSHVKVRCDRQYKSFKEALAMAQLIVCELISE